MGVVEGIELVDSSRNNYRIPLRIQYPIGVAGPRPVVIWNHGGNPSVNGNTRSENWGRVLAAAGYIVIHPSRVPVENPEDSQCECTENGFNSPDECAQWLANLRYGPQNTHFIIDNLTRIVSMAPRFAGLFDISKIVVAGHSAGTTTVLANAGAASSGSRADRSITNATIARSLSWRLDQWARYMPGSAPGLDRPALWKWTGR